MEFLKRNLFSIVVFALVAGMIWYMLRRPSQTIANPNGDDAYELVTLLPKDAIPSIDNPTFYSAIEADREYEPQEMVLGITIDGEHKAYSTSLLNQHEIVNDTIAGRPIAVTW